MGLCVQIVLCNRSIGRKDEKNGTCQMTSVDAVSS